MKNTIFFILLFSAKIGFAEIQVKYDTAGTYFYCDIEPILCDVCADTVNRLSFTLFDNNAVNHAQLYWATRHDNSMPQWSGNLDLSGADYIAFREVNTDEDSFAKARWIYQYISDHKPQIIPIE